MSGAAQPRIITNPRGASRRLHPAPQPIQKPERLEALMSGAAQPRIITNPRGTSRRLQPAPQQRAGFRMERLLNGTAQPNPALSLTEDKKRRTVPTLLAAGSMPTSVAAAPASALQPGLSVAARHRKHPRRAAPAAAAASSMSAATIPPKFRHMGASVHDMPLKQAFEAVDRDQTGVLSKRQLYDALAQVGLTCAPSEQLSIWRLFDRDNDGKVTWSEFRSLGVALLEVGEGAPPQHDRKKGHGAFAQREHEETRRMHFAAQRIQKLARQRSADQRGLLKASFGWQ